MAHLLSTTFATCFHRPREMQNADCSGHFGGLQELSEPDAATEYLVSTFKTLIRTPIVILPDPLNINELLIKKQTLSLRKVAKNVI